MHQRNGDLFDRSRGPGSIRTLAWAAALFGPLLLVPFWVALIGRVAPGSPLGTATGLVLFLLLATCAVTDLTRSKIPNWATYPALLWALLINLSARAGGTAGPLGAVGPTDCLGGAATCFAIMLPIYQLAGGGAGDVKLATALGALLGIERGLDSLICSYLVAGVVVLAWALWVFGPIALLKSFARKAASLLLPSWAGRPSPEQERLLRSPIPLGAFFALGTLAALSGWEVR